MFNSVRFRITLWYAAALAVTLAVFSVLVYNSLEKSLDENMDQLLAFRAEGVADALEAYLETERIEVGRGSASAAKGGAFRHIAPELVKLHTDDPRQASVDLRILDAAGRELVGSGNPAAAPDLPGRTLAEALKGNASYDTVKMGDGAGNLFRSYATPAARKEVKKVEIVTGEITAIDAAKNEITVKTHKGELKTFALEADKLAGLAQGEKVKVSVKDGKASVKAIKENKGKHEGRKPEMKKPEAAPAAGK